MSLERRVSLPPSVLQNWRELRRRAIDTAQIHPTIPNYVVFPWVNKNGENGEDLIDHKAEDNAAEALVHAFAGIDPDYVLAIENSGVSFGKAVKRHYPKAQFITAQKLDGHDQRQNHNDDLRYVTAHSYSRNQDFKFALPRIPKGKKVLIIDDVSAQGGVGLPIASAVQQMGGEVVGFGVYFDKAFQEGLQKIARKLGILCFSVIRLSEINHNHIKLMDEQSSLQLIK